MFYGATAGMSGGLAFIYDEAGDFPLYVNPDSVIWQRLNSAHREGVVNGLIAEHVRETRSKFAARLLNDWPLGRGKFWQIVPKEMLTRLPQPLSDTTEEKRA